MSPCLDIYLDSFPRGSCNTIFEAVQSQVPFCIMDTSHNRESSALPYFSAFDANFPGLCTSIMHYVQFASDLISSKSKRANVSQTQKALFDKLASEGSKNFSRNYLSFFLDHA